MPRLSPNRTRPTSVLVLLLAAAVCAGWAARTASTAGNQAPAKPRPAGRKAADAEAQRAAREAYGQMAMSFEANRGQIDAEVNFLAHGPGYNLFLTRGEAVLVLQQACASAPGARRADDDDQVSPLNNVERRRATAEAAAVGSTQPPTVLRMQLVNANARPAAVRGEGELPGKVNYLFGSDPAEWRTDIPTYGAVRYEQVYPGVDMVYYGNQQQLEYDFVVAPGIDPGVINLNYAGAQVVRPDGGGGLTLKTAGGDLRQHKPIIYQEERDGTRKEIGGEYVLKGDGQVGFKISKYDRRKPLVIDPVLSYLSFVNAGGNASAIAVDPSGFAYITGSITISGGGPPFDLPPTPGAYQQASGGGSDVFVTKINQAGNGVVYSTFLGGNGDDAGYGIAADLAGNAYVTGSASGTFPVTPGAPQPVRGSTFDAFVSKLNATGSALVYSTFIGGNEYDDGDGIAVDAAGNAYVAGQTYSSNLATTPGAVRPTSGGGSDSFIAKLNSSGGLAYLTYLGGGGLDLGFGIAVDDAGNAYTTGQTSSLNFPQVNGLQNPGGLDRGFFRSTDSGANYTLRRTGMNDSFVYAIAVNPTTPTIIYAGTGGGVYKTTDGSASWTQASGASAPRGTIRAVLIDRNTTSTVYAGGGQGVFKSTDSGNTWAAINNGLAVAAAGGLTFAPSVNALASPVGAPNTIYAATSNGVFKTTDGGANWGALTLSLTGVAVNSVAIDPANQQIVYAGTTGGVSKSTNGGTIWTTVNTALNTAASRNINTLVIDPTNSATLYAATQAGVYKSTTSAASWGVVNTGLLQPQSDGSTRSNPPIRSLVINPNAPGTLYAGARGAFALSGVTALTTVFKTTDGGANWTAVRNGFGNFNTVWSLALDPVTPTTVYAGTLGDTDAYLTKLNSNGTALVYSTYLGGGRTDAGLGVAVDSTGSAYVSGFTQQGSGFPVTAGALQSVIKGDSDIFLTKFNPAGTTRVFSTLFGGSSHEDTDGVALDNAGNVYVTGGTYSTDLPVTPGAFQSRLGGNGLQGDDDAFVAKINPSGSGLLYSSYLGGPGFEPDGTAIPLSTIGVDAFGNAYIVGTTSGGLTPFGFANAFNAGIGASGTYVAKIDASTPSVSVTGRLTTTGGTPIANQGVELRQPNGRVRFATTDSQGYYSFISLLPGDYTVTPDQFGGGGQFSFTPALRNITVAGADQTADFVGAPLYNISGVITDQATGFGVNGITVTLTGSVSATTTTGQGGLYQFNGLTSGGNYTVTPSKAGYTFAPVNRTFTNLSADQFTANFTTPSAHFYTVSGRVADVNAVGVSGVTVAISPGSATVGFAVTDVAGNYSIPNVQSDQFAYIIPLKQRLTFTPNLPTINNLAGPTTVNFTAQTATGLTGKIAFSRPNQPPGNGENIVVMNADGTNPTNVTTGTTSYDEEPAWSPDGAKLAFVRAGVGNQTPTDEIYTINADGTGLVPLTQPPISNSNPSWSPDGAQIVYGDGDCSDGDGTPVEIYKSNADGTGRTRLTSNVLADGFPAWSPFGTKIAFSRALDSDCSGSEADIWTMNADGSAQTRLTSGAGNLDFNAVWSPDGTKLAFVRETNNAREQIYVMNADGTGVTNLTPFAENTFSVTWSPDSTKLAIEAPLPGMGTQIVVMNANGTGLTLVSDPTVGGFDPAWQPDRSVQPANIGGQIVDTNGFPVAGVNVALGGSQVSTATTDANGFYVFRNLLRGANYTLTPALTGRTFTPAVQNVNGLLGTRTANFGSAALTVSVSGRVLDVNNPTAGVGGVTVTLSGSFAATTTTDANGNYLFAGLAPGGNYTVTPARTNYEFESPAQAFTNVQSNRTANFIATQVFVISGRVTDGATGAGVPDVTITISGTRTVVTKTNQTGNYAVSIAAGGTYSVTATSPYNVFTPPRADFPNLSAPQTANFATVPVAVPTPTPPLSDNFNTPFRDPEKWNLGTLSQDPASVDPLVPVVQRAGHLEITPRPNVTGEHYNGYVSVRPFDLSGGTASVEVVQTTTSTAETIFGVGSDNQNNYRFVVTSVGNASASVKAQLARSPYHWILTDAGALVLVFQVRIAGVVTQEVIPYDPTAHRFWRFRHDPPANAIAFETSPDNNAFTERFRKVLEKSVSALAVELTAGTATPTSGGGTAIYDNLNISTSSMEFTAATFSAPENVGGATLTVIRTGNVAGPATVDYATVDNPANVRCDDVVNNQGASYARCDYATSVDTLTFAPGETQKSFKIPIIDDAFVEGNETIRVILRNPTGAGLDAGIGAATLTIVDNDTNPNVPNPVFTSPFFIRQQYLDFLSREPDSGGFNAYLNLLNGCADVNNLDPNAPSAACDRITVSAAFFGSPEFRLKGFYVFNFYQVAFNGQLPAYADIITDMRSVTGRTGAETFQKRANFATAFTRRQAFRDLYDAKSDADYVAALLARYSLTQITTPDPANPDGTQTVTLSAAQLTSQLTAGTLTRAQVLRAVVQSNEVGNAEFNRAFVAMQYYGYLRRRPETGGYNAWLNYLRDHPDDFRTMVNGFMNSQEYRIRFGTPNQ